MGDVVSQFIAVAAEEGDAGLQLVPLAPQLAAQLALPVTWQAQVAESGRITLAQDLRVVSQKSARRMEPHGEVVRIIANVLRATVEAAGAPLPAAPFIVSRDNVGAPLAAESIVVQLGDNILAGSADLHAHVAVSRAQARALAWDQSWIMALLEAAQELELQPGMFLPAAAGEGGGDACHGVLQLVDEQAENRCSARWLSTGEHAALRPGDVLRRTVCWNEIGFSHRRSITAEVGVVVE